MGKNSITHFGFNEDVVESGLSYTEFWNEMNTNKRHYSDATNFKDAIIMSKEMVDKGYVNSSFLSDTYDMAQTALAEAGVKLYGGVSGNADAAVQALLDGTLVYNPNVQCNHHGESHGAGAHDCGHHGENHGGQGHSCGGHGSCQQK